VKKTYQKPMLEIHGSVKSLTQFQLTPGSDDNPFLHLLNTPGPAASP
jgi:hypothetical protein